MNKSIYLKLKKCFLTMEIKCKRKPLNCEKLKCLGINVNYMIFSQPYETSFVIFIDFCTNEN